MIILILSFHYGPITIVEVSNTYKLVNWVRSTNYVSTVDNNNRRHLNQIPKIPTLIKPLFYKRPNPILGVLDY